MPIVASRGSEIRRLLGELADPKRRAGAVMRLKGLGSRVVPHVAEDLGRLDPEARSGLLEALGDIKTSDGKALKKRLERLEPSPRAQGPAPREAGAEATGLDALRALPPPGNRAVPGTGRERRPAGWRYLRSRGCWRSASLPP